MNATIDEYVTSSAAPVRFLPTPAIEPVPADSPSPDPARAFPYWNGELLPWPLIAVILQHETLVTTGERFIWRAVISDGRHCLLVSPTRLIDFYRQHADRVFDIYDAQHDHVLLGRIYAACTRSNGP